jgi:hypothetical protein
MPASGETDRQTLMWRARFADCDSVVVSHVRQPDTKRLGSIFRIVAKNVDPVEAASWYAARSALWPTFCKDGDTAPEFEKEAITYDRRSKNDNESSIRRSQGQRGRSSAGSLSATDTRTRQAPPSGGRCRVGELLDRRHIAHPHHTHFPVDSFYIINGSALQLKSR